VSELPGMWDESDLSGGLADTENGGPFEMFTERVSESICEYNIRSMQKGDGDTLRGLSLEGHRILVRAIRNLERGQALVIVRRS